MELGCSEDCEVVCHVMAVQMMKQQQVASHHVHVHTSHALLVGYVAVVCLCLKEATSGVVSQWKRSIIENRRYSGLLSCVVTYESCTLSLMGVCGFIAGTVVHLTEVKVSSLL